MTDNGQTPLVIVDAMAEGVSVPVDFVEDDHIVLNMSWSATRNLQMDNDFISFATRFSGTSCAVNFPVAAVKGIYARESGQGMMFQDEPAITDHQADASAEKPEAENAAGEEASPKRGRPGLRIVK